LVVRARADRCLSPVCACWCEQVWRREYTHAWCSYIAQRNSAPESNHRFGYSVEQIDVQDKSRTSLITERNCAMHARDHEPGTNTVTNNVDVVFSRTTSLTKITLEPG
jgi:hypothetical protein